MSKPSAKLSDVAASDRRVEQRHTMILRVGVIEHQDKTSLCLLTNISTTGTQVKLYAPVRRAAKVRVRVADEDWTSGHVAWVKGDRAGIRFLQDLDPDTLPRWEQKSAPSRRRTMPRIKTAAYALLRVDGRTFPVKLCDISSMGARVSTRRTFSASAAAVVIFPDLPPIRAYVRWSEEGETGLIFETPIPMQILANWIDGRLRVTA